MEHSRVATCKQNIINIYQKIKDISIIRQDKQGGVNLGGKKTNEEQEITQTSVPYPWCLF
jgi:hypothetical protein